VCIYEHLGTSNLWGVHGGVRKVKVTFANLRIEFVDRERALEQVRELGGRGTFPVYVVYGPEGCGKTAFLRQARAILEEEFGYHVVYVNPLARRAEEVLQYTQTVEGLVKEALKLFPEPYSRVVDVAVNVASLIIERFSKPRVAVLMDDIFQAVGVDQAEVYTKTLLNLIEWPPREYERIIVLVASSEGVTWEKIGRHSWASIFAMWNMQRRGFEELYELLPEPKPSFEDVWRLTGGNPRYLEKLFATGWRVESVVDNIVEDRRVIELVGSLSSTEVEVLREAIENPDVLLEGYRETASLAGTLIERNLIARVKRRDPHAWIDEPPPERDPELGIGRYYAWQTPLHREAVKRALELVAQRRV